MASPNGAARGARAPPGGPPPGPLLARRAPTAEGDALREAAQPVPASFGTHAGDGHYRELPRVPSDSAARPPSGTSGAPAPSSRIHSRCCPGRTRNRSRPHGDTARSGSSENRTHPPRKSCGKRVFPPPWIGHTLASPQAMEREDPRRFADLVGGLRAV